MITVILTIHIIITIALVGIILLQKHEGGGLGFGGGSSNFLSGRGVENLLSKTTKILGFAFFLTSMILAILVARMNKTVEEKINLAQQEQNETSTPTSTENGETNEQTNTRQNNK